MTRGIGEWPEIHLAPDAAVAGSLVYADLKSVELRRLANTKRYDLVCEKTGLAFRIPVSAILSEFEDENDPYQPEKAAAGLFAALSSDWGRALRQFVHYSPWLISSLKVEGVLLRTAQQGAMLARLAGLLLGLMEKANLAVGPWQNSYHLLIRARFLLLARLSQAEQKDEAGWYLPDLDLQVREAWRAWSQVLLQSPQEMRLLLARYQRSIEEEGRLLLFRPGEQELWGFALDKADLPYTHLLLTSWFLPRYDVQQVALALTLLEAQAAGEAREQATGSSLETGRHQAAAYLYQAASNLPLRIAGHTIILVVLAIPLVFPGLAAKWPSLAYITWAGAALLAFAIAVVQVAVLGMNSVRYTLPRITLAISVGYLALVSSGELMTFAIRAYDCYPALAWATVGGSLLLSLAAIFLGGRRHLDDGILAVRRGSMILLMAATRSLILGWLILAPAGSLLLFGSPAAVSVQHVWRGPLGLPIYPQLIFILAPLALFIGIFIQTIWDEYALTHPI